jgi:uncharacterized surface protein with fasciclin (FAS1) repeats
MKNIIETAVGNPDFSTLVTAIKAAGLVETLSGAGPFTVFAPTNQAFAKIPMATLDSVLADKTKLTSILTYHVVSGKVMAKDVATMTEVTTVEGSKVNVSAESDFSITEASTPNVSAMEVSEHSGIMINDAKITTSDIECSNGVIHVIDTVLMLAVK